MSKSKIIIVLVVIVFIGTVVFLISKTPDDKISESKKKNNIKAEHVEKEKQISDIKKALKRSLKLVFVVPQNNPVEIEGEMS